MMSSISRNLFKNLPSQPGVYQMLGNKGEVLYVGKARNLRKRVQSYFRDNGLPPRVLALMQQVVAIDTTVTHTENEALLVENNLIKSIHPRYNILLRDDKSYPYIFVSDGQQFPRIGFHRGAKREKGRYFGPYPSAYAVHESLNQLQKIFRVRQCQDSFFRNRSRPCLQYQIKRCSAPCVNMIGPERYRADVQQAIMFMEGRNQAILRECIKKMERASDQQDYEAAAAFRDRIAIFKRIQERQYVSGRGGDADVLAVAVTPELACVAVSFIRGGQNLGSKSFFPRMGAETDPGEILSAFMPQYYLSETGTGGRTIPPHIYLNEPITDTNLLESVFSQKAGKKIVLSLGRRGSARRWVQMARINANESLRRKLADKVDMRTRFDALRDALALEATPERVECFDVSHTMGEATVASCVVFDVGGPVKSDYRRFNIKSIEPGDDYGALTQALTRRYRQVKEGGGRLPDLLMIDGGKGQLSTTEAVLQELQLEGVKLVAVAKGRDRKPGREQLFLSGSSRGIALPATSAALHLIQQIRDEAHRFAIAGHRARRGKVRTTSALEGISGIGGRRRQALLKNFGGLREVARAGVEDLSRVPGISPKLAQKIYDVFHVEE